MLGFTNPKQKVLKILNKEFKYFLRLSAIATKLTRDESKENRDAAIHELRNLKIFQRREQMFAPISKLKHAIQDMASKTKFDAGTQRQLQAHVQNLEALEASILFDTVKRLEPLLKTSGQIDWKSVRETTRKIVDNLRGAVIVDQQLRSIVEKGPSGQFAFARR